MAPPPVSDSAGSPCLHGCPGFLPGISHCHLLPHVPSGFSLQSIAELAPNRSTIPRLQLPALRLPGDFVSLHPSPRGTYGCGKNCLCDSHSIQTLTDQLLHSQPQVPLLCPLNSFLSLQGHPRWDQTPASVPPPSEGRSSPTDSPLSPHFLHPTEFCVVLYSLLQWPGALACSQLPFCKISCV